MGIGGGATVLHCQSMMSPLLQCFVAFSGSQILIVLDTCAAARCLVTEYDK